MTTPKRLGFDGGVVAGTAALAVAVRLIALLHSGGLRGIGRYDDGTYYAAADALTFGRVPYRDVVQLQPPGLLLVLAPFAALGRITSDWVGLAAGRIFFIGIGGLNTALVFWLARRWSRPAAIVASVLYAVWLPAVYVEQTTLMEPLGGLAILVALLLVCRRTSPPTARAYVAAGLVLGFATTDKIWYVAAWAGVVLWLAAARQWRAAAQVVAGGVACAVVVMGPFFALAPHAMFDMVIRDQLRRARSGAAPLLVRLATMIGSDRLVGDHALRVAVVIVTTAIVVVAAAVAGRDRDARLIVLVLVLNSLLLLLTPSYFIHYGVLVAQPLVLVVGIAVARVGRWRPQTRLGSGLTVAAVGIAVILGITVSVSRHAGNGHSFPGDRLAAALPPGCIAADDMTALVEANRLSSDLSLRTCLVPVDVSGLVYDDLKDHQAARINDPKYQAWLLRYLTSADAFVVIHPTSLGLAAEDRDRLEHRPLVARVGPYRIRSGYAATDPALADPPKI